MLKSALAPGVGSVSDDPSGDLIGDFVDLGGKIRSLPVLSKQSSSQLSISPRAENK